ncbi:MAG: DUF4330 domain-containing protein [Candidatus Omnitrophica bacterium]|nr:DUF4330 domain-containing protein [Candidatus Omnitrophota bacterium]
MKVIDDKGRLFGKINIIDFLALVFLVCLLPIFYLGYKVFTQEPIDTEAKEFIEIMIDVRFIKLRPEVAKVISIGDKEFDNDGHPIGEVVELGDDEPYVYKFNIGEGQAITKKDVVLRQIEAKLRLKAEIRKGLKHTIDDDRLLYKNDIVGLGLPLEFKTGKYAVTAIPLRREAVEGAVIERTIDLYVTLKELDEDILSKIAVGDKDMDDSGNVIAEILNVGKVEGNFLDLNVGGDNFITGEVSGKKQAAVKMRLKCELKGSRLYFKEEEILYNTPFHFKTNKYEVNAVVAKTFEVVTPVKEKWVSLRVKFSEIAPEIISIIQKGDTERDINDRAVARVNSAINISPSQVLSVKDDDLVMLGHPFYKDLEVFLDVLCVEKDGIYYFKNYPVKMGNSIVFSTELYSMSGVIRGIEIK